MKCDLTARGASLADFIQPSLGPLQPQLDDIMDTLNKLEPLQGTIMIKLLIRHEIVARYSFVWRNIWFFLI